MAKTARLLVVVLLAGCAAIVGRPTVTQLTIDPPVFMLAYPLVYTTTDGKERIEVPRGFVTDLASIPRGLWWWQAPHEATMAPAIVHDFLYWEQPCSKAEADAVMVLAMKHVGMSDFSIDGVYEGIRSKYGQQAWDRNRDARAGGEPRFFTEAFAMRLMSANVDPKATLRSIQDDAIRTRGAASPAFSIAAIQSACRAALREVNERKSL